MSQFFLGKNAQASEALTKLDYQDLVLIDLGGF